MDTPENIPSETVKDKNTVTLDFPITRGNKCIDKITVRKPTAGELRGVTVNDLVAMDVSALIKVIPRISSPTLNEHDAANLDPADLGQLGMKVAGFFVTKAMRKESPYPTE